MSRKPVAQTFRPVAKKAAGYSSLVLGLVIGGVSLLIGVAITLAVVFWPPAKKSEPAAANNPPTPGPVEPEPAGGES